MIVLSYVGSLECSGATKIDCVRDAIGKVTAHLGHDDFELRINVQPVVKNTAGDPCYWEGAIDFTDLKPHTAPSTLLESPHV